MRSLAITSIDLSSLIGYTGYTNSVLAASRASRAAAGAGTNVAAPIVKGPTPWDVSSNPLSESARLTAAMRATKLVDENDPSFAKPGVPDDHKKLFALYKALSTLQTLAQRAAGKETPSGLLPGLDARFQAGFSEAMKYAGDLSFDSLSLITGAKRSTAVTDIGVTRISSAFQTRALAQGDPQKPVAALEDALGAAGVFTINVKRGSTNQDITIDLGEMDPALPRNLGNVVNFINTALKDAGVMTRLKRVELPAATPAKGMPTPPKQYGIQIDTGGIETLTFTAQSAKPALYLANQGVDSGELRKLDISGADPITTFRMPIDDDGAKLNVKQTVRDDQGNVFVLGTTDGDQGAQLNQSPQDVMLRKYDSAGNLLWSKLMGATTRTEGLALAVDSKGAAVIAGQLTGRLDSQVSLGGSNSYVMKISAAGEQVFATQMGSVLADAATALAVGPDDAIYVGGYAQGRMTGADASYGGSDNFVMKFSATGTRAYTRQFGGAGDERVAALAFSDDGSLIVASTEGGQGVVRKFSAADASSPAIWEQSLGAVGSGGAIAGLAVEGGAIYVAGSTTNGALSAPVTAAHSGGQDGFVLKLNDGGGSATADFVSYVGTGSTDRINGVTVEGGRIFVAGETRGTLPGATQTFGGKTNAFAAEIGAGGTLEWARQFGVTSGEGYGRGIAVDLNGGSVLDALGLPTGVLAPHMTRTITAQTTARAGDYFEIKVGDNVARKIAIDAGETMTTLARKINRVLVLDGKASVVRSSKGETLRIEPREGQTIELIAGKDNLDALAGLGLSPGRVTKADPDAKTPFDPDAIQEFALGLKGSYSLGSTASAQSALNAMDRALSEIRKAYREITTDPEIRRMMHTPNDQKGKQGGAVPAYLQSQLANYNAGLSRLLGGGGSSGGLF